MRTTTTTSTTARRSRARLGLAAAGLAATFALAACGGGMSAEEAAGGGGGEAAELPEFTGEYDGPEVELSYWNGFTGGDGPFMQGMVEQFMEENPNITVTPNTIQWADFYQRLPAAVNAGEGPDVGVMHLDQLATNAARNVIVPLDELADGIGLTEDDFSEEVWQAGIYQDARYGIPLDVHSLAMYYNTEHFAAAGITEPPTDQASFMDALDKLQAAGYETPFWSPTLWPAHLMFYSLTWQNGGEPFAEDGSEATFGSPEGVEALEWQRSLVDEGYSPSDVAQDSQYVAFKNGETSITWDGIWQINDLQASELPWGIAPVPTIFDEDRVWANSHQFFMTKQASGDADKAAAAQVFIAWMSEHSEDWAQAGMIPARQSVRDGGALEGLPQQIIAERIDDMRFLPPVPGIGTVATEALEPAVANGVLGKSSPEEALTGAAVQATELMQENLESFGG
ncbi:ABC transporter substrate-binding protein [Cellulomonas marina]|uniref:Multiple sugar transport system substrate-binding protein n=1 Tax=Cellulomonas marina TaxID=988821 RepID=A0A1I0Y1W0_9CELL|nr:ABC transporter substrate-binding protein [Cellulomonas marina]GIG28413.1 ABC transporter substrate-binding protein [Cellulomonas marina]SFB06867.1 multiple sugar transport system substrate-binding protein [Cellulomonas marina]